MGMASRGKQRRSCFMQLGSVIGKISYYSSTGKGAMQGSQSICMLCPIVYLCNACLIGLAQVSWKEPASICSPCPTVCGSESAASPARHL